jgi:hypothetical protein
VHDPLGRVLVVDDNDPWRGYVLAKLCDEHRGGIAQRRGRRAPSATLKRSGADGHLPPRISGIEAARRIWRGSPTEFFSSATTLTLASCGPPQCGDAGMS